MSRVRKARELTEASIEEVKDPKFALNMGMVAEKFDSMLGLEPARLPGTPKRPGVRPAEAEQHSIATPGGGSPGVLVGGGALVVLPAREDEKAAVEDEYQWLAMETAHGIEIHTQVSWTSRSTCLGSRAVIWLGAGSAAGGEKVISCYKSRTSSLEEDKPHFESTLAMDTTPPSHLARLVIWLTRSSMMRGSSCR